MAKRPPIERYNLYGEPQDAAELRFLHIERINLRSGMHDWTIAPHVHSDLHQILLVLEGGGAMLAEAERLEVSVPALLIVPALCVHGFAFIPGTDGHVITVAKELVSEASRGDALVAALLEAPVSIGGLGNEETAGLIRAFETLSQEFVWSAPGRGLAIESELVRILVSAGRLALERRRGSMGERDADAALIERYRRLIEAEFRSGASVRDYARQLGITEDRLLAVCRRKLGEPPKNLIHRRQMVEAQRWLLYTTMSVGEISYALGFRDAAYFSRFFSQRAGKSPLAFRQGH